MKSRVFNGTNGMERILDETESFGASRGLPAASAIKLRLLAEEMMGLTVRLFEDLEYEFFIENEGMRFTVRLSAKTLVSLKQKDKILSLSNSGDNAATKGILGKISGIFQDMLIVSREPADDLSPVPVTYDGIGDLMYFSMSEYRNWLSDEAAEDQWDGVEKSIIANIVGDVTVGVKNNRVEMAAVIEF